MLCVVDISGIGVKQVWNLRGYLQDLSKLFATNYPEILDKVLVCGLLPTYNISCLPFGSLRVMKNRC